MGEPSSRCKLNSWSPHPSPSLSAELMEPDVDGSDRLINGGPMTLQQTDGLLFTGCLTAACFWNNVVTELSLTCSFSYCLWHFCAP